MRRRWTTDQYMARYERRLERRAFYKAYDDVTHPPSPDGTRLCKNCAKNETCGLNRRRNHGSCFERAESQVEERNEGEKGNAPASSDGCLIIAVLAMLGVIGIVIALCAQNTAVACFVLIFVIIVVLSLR